VPAPQLVDLVPALEHVDPFLTRARRGSHGSVAATNAEGGDPAGHADPRLLARHLGHYLAAAEVAAGVTAGPDDARLLDVGSGTGAFSAWLADRLGLPLHLVDHDPAVLATAAAVHEVAGTHTDLAAAPRSGVVTAMEVLEHVPTADQAGFLTTLVDRIAPGGVLVLSTPDESHYPGGWSGYAPHIGCVQAEELLTMLQRAAPGRGVEVFRIVGGPYDVPLQRRWVEAVGNRVLTQLQRRTPALAARLAAGGASHGDGPVLDVGRVAGLHRVRVLPATSGTGGSLLGVVHG
jgi:SAM-dependent methyltransferase